MSCSLLIIYRRLLVSLVTLLLFLLVVASASAASKVGLVSSPVRVARGYSLFVVAGGKELTVFVQKARGGSTQNYEVSATHGSVTVGTGLGAGSVSANLGQYGRVRLRFSPGGARNISAPNSCRLVRGGRVVFGELTGTVRITIGSHLFTASRLPARAIKGATLQCARPPNRPSHGLTLFAYGLGIDTPTVSWNRDSKGRLFELASLIRGRTTDPASLFAFIYAKASSSALTAAADLSTAQARSAGPFLRGSVKFTRTPLPLVGKVAQGTVTGAFSALFDLLGTMRLPDPTQGILSRN